MWFCDDFEKLKKDFKTKVYILSLNLIQYVIEIGWTLFDIRIIRISF